jgi:hypothetical protein
MAKKKHKKKRVKVQAKKVDNNKDVVHVRLEKPIATRKQILMAAIEGTRLLKKNEEMQLIKKKKQLIIAKLGKVMREVKTLERRIIKEIPAVKENKKTEIHKIKEVKITKELDLPSKQPKKPTSEIERLQKELEGIESKLKSL